MTALISGLFLPFFVVLVRFLAAALSLRRLVKRALPSPVPMVEHAPALDVLHEGHLGEPLHHAVIVHQHRGVVIADLRDRLRSGLPAG